MRRRPITASVEFLKSEPGRQLARTMVAEYLESESLRPEPVPVVRDINLYFEDLLREYIEHLDHDIEPYVEPPGPHYDGAALRKALADAYADRFRDLFPKTPEEIGEYLLRLTRMVRWLAKLTCEVWLLDTYPDPAFDYPVKNEDDKTVRVYHLQWAREAFGWWRANVARFRYRLRLPRPCRCEQDSANALIFDALDDELRARLEAVGSRGGVEVEEGCPLC